jgi:uncharacterized protein
MSEQASDSADATDNTGASRFELRADGWLAELVYRIRGDRLVLVHTEVPFELEGRGIGGRLVTAAVDRAARRERRGCGRRGPQASVSSRGDMGPYPARHRRDGDDDGSWMASGKARV